MLTRQKILLRLISQCGGETSRLKLTKLAFILSITGQSERIETFYQFLPYLYGPYSFTLDHELDALLRDGCIRFPNKDTIALTQAGLRRARESADVRLLRDIEILVHDYSRLAETELLDRVYVEHPWFTINSVRRNGKRQRKVIAKPANYISGYQQYHVDGFLNRLLECGIATIYDTRKNPISRRFGFHKSTLSKLSGKVGIAYQHLPELGVPSDWRQDLTTSSAYEELFDKYSTDILMTASDAVIELAKSLASEPGVIICQEADSSHCHRSVLAKKIQSLNGLNIVEV